MWGSGDGRQRFFLFIYTLSKVPDRQELALLLSNTTVSRTISGILGTAAHLVFKYAAVEERYYIYRWEKLSDLPKFEDPDFSIHIRIEVSGFKTIVILRSSIQFIVKLLLLSCR